MRAGGGAGQGSQAGEGGVQGEGAGSAAAADFVQQLAHLLARGLEGLKVEGNGLLDLRQPVSQSAVGQPPPRRSPSQPVHVCLRRCPSSPCDDALALASCGKRKAPGMGLPEDADTASRAAPPCVLRASACAPSPLGRV